MPAWITRADRLKIRWAAWRNPDGPRLAEPDPATLRGSLEAAWAVAGATSPPPFDALIAAWSAPHRRYHALGHLAALLDGLAVHRDLAERLAEVELGLWLHDAIQVPGRDDDEARSAALAWRLLRDGDASESVARRVADLVLATGPARPDHGPDGALLSDLDLSVLGADPERYEHYVAQVRAEYGWVGERRWRAGRRRVLESLLERGLYRTDRFRERLEEAARDNLRRELEALGRPGS
jgi:predicted metal-dependent HD superfamily phosphohydrolase